MVLVSTGSLWRVEKVCNDGEVFAPIFHTLNTRESFHQPSLCSQTPWDSQQPQTPMGSLTLYFNEQWLFFFISFRFAVHPDLKTCVIYVWIKFFQIYLKSPGTTKNASKEPCSFLFFLKLPAKRTIKLNSCFPCPVLNKTNQIIP